MFIQFSDCRDGFLHQLPAERIETFGAIELFEIVRYMDRNGIGGRYFDDADLAGDF